MNAKKDKREKSFRVNTFSAVFNNYKYAPKTH